MRDVYAIQTMTLEDRVNDLLWALGHGDVLAAMRNVDAINRQLVGIATELVEAGVREGLTQAAMARALDVPPSTLRGAKREYAA